MQIARTGYLAAYSLMRDATSKAWFRRRDILPPRMPSATRPSPRRVKPRTTSAQGSQFYSEWWQNGAPEEIRTPDPQIRSLVLYPAELRARFRGHLGPKACFCRVQSGYIFCRSRKRAIATGSGPAWQGPESSAWRSIYARARSLRTLRSSTGRSGIVMRKVAPMVPSTR
jgi:hypothetical protein